MTEPVVNAPIGELAWYDAVQNPLLRRMFGCDWGPLTISTPDDPEECLNRATDNFCIHADVPRYFRLCPLHGVRVEAETNHSKETEHG